ncbi:alpha-crystallin A chain-like [Pomacea canaliculata]|nr:alpha-crystallin A chain-like [Pomacea canaliculata]
MALINAFLRDLWSDPWKEMTGSSRLFDQDFGYVLSPEDMVVPRYWRHPMMVPRMQRPPQASGMSEVVNDEKEFRMSLDVKHFKPEEINVKTRDNRVVIEAKHEERPDEHGFIMRQFTRQYVLPKDVDPNAVTSTLSPDGMLTIKAPKKALPETEERVIPIEHEATQKLEQ